MEWFHSKIDNLQIKRNWMDVQWETAKNFKNAAKDYLNRSENKSLPKEQREKLANKILLFLTNIEWNVNKVNEKFDKFKEEIIEASYENKINLITDIEKENYLLKEAQNFEPLINANWELYSKLKKEWQSKHEWVFSAFRIDKAMAAAWITNQVTFFIDQLWRMEQENDEVMLWLKSMLALKRKWFWLNELLNSDLSKNTLEKINSDPQNKIFYKHFLKFKISPYANLLLWVNKAINNPDWTKQAQELNKANANLITDLIKDTIEYLPPSVRKDFINKMTESIKPKSEQEKIKQEMLNLLWTKHYVERFGEFTWNNMTMDWAIWWSVSKIWSSLAKMESCRKVFTWVSKWADFIKVPWLVNQYLEFVPKILQATPEWSQLINSLKWIWTSAFNLWFKVITPLWLLDKSDIPHKKEIKDIFLLLIMLCPAWKEVRNAMNNYTKNPTPENTKVIESSLQEVLQKIQQNPNLLNTTAKALLWTSAFKFINFFTKNKFWKKVALKSSPKEYKEPENT